MADVALKEKQKRDNHDFITELGWDRRGTVWNPSPEILYKRRLELLGMPLRH